MSDPTVRRAAEAGNLPAIIVGLDPDETWLVTSKHPVSREQSTAASYRFGAVVYRFANILQTDGMHAMAIVRHESDECATAHEEEGIQGMVEPMRMIALITGTGPVDVQHTRGGVTFSDVSIPDALPSDFA